LIQKALCNESNPRLQLGKLPFCRGTARVRTVGYRKRGQLRGRIKSTVRHGNVVVDGDLLRMRNALILLVTPLLAVTVMPGGVDRAAAEDAPSAIARMMVPGPEYDLIRAMKATGTCSNGYGPGQGQSLLLCLP